MFKTLECGFAAGGEALTMSLEHATPLYSITEHNSDAYDNLKQKFLSIAHPAASRQHCVDPDCAHLPPRPP